MKERYLDPVGERYWREGDRKVTLNFAALEGYPIDPQVLRDHFDPRRFLIKLTPLNPTEMVRRKGLRSWIDPFDPSSWRRLVEGLEEAGFEVLLSIGELEENLIGSNCGQYVTILEEGRLRFRPYRDAPFTSCS